MDQEPQKTFFLPHLDPEQNYLRAIYLSVSRTAVLASDLAVWALTGTAVLLGVVIANIESVSKIVSAPALKWAFVCFGCSVVIGAIVRSIGICVSQGIRFTDTLYEHLLSETGAKILSAIESKFNEVLAKINEPFFGPMRWWMDYSLKKSTKDFIHAEKRFVKMVCWQIYLGATQSFLAVLGIAILALGIKGG